MRDPFAEIAAMREAFFARCATPAPPGLDEEQGRVYNRAMAQAEAYLSAGRIDLYRPMMVAGQTYLENPSPENAAAIEEVSLHG